MTFPVAAAHVLALGLEPRDALRGQRVAHPVRVDLEHPFGRALRRRSEPYRSEVRPGAPQAKVSRHDSGRHVLLYHPTLGDHVDLRLYDHDRTYVPRRLRVPLLAQAAAPALPPAHRIRHPVLFPGAGHPVSERVAGLRGRVLRAGAPMRWARIEARLPNGNALVGRAQGDDRGEFLLLIEPGAAPFGDLAAPIAVRVIVSGPAVVPQPATPDVPARDPFWDLPLETVPAPGAPDTVSSGEAPPEGYAVSLAASRIVPFELGRILTGADVAPFEFSLAP